MRRFCFFGGFAGCNKLYLYNGFNPSQEKLLRTKDFIHWRGLLLGIGSWIRIGIIYKGLRLVSLFLLLFMYNLFLGAKCRSCIGGMEICYTGIVGVSSRDVGNLSAEEVENIVSSEIFSSAEEGVQKVLTADELADVYSDVAHSIYNRLGYIPLEVDSDLDVSGGQGDTAHMDARGDGGFDLVVSCREESASLCQELYARINQRRTDFLRTRLELRSFLDEAYNTLGDTSWLRHSTAPKVPLPDLLDAHNLRASAYIGLANVPRDDSQKFLQALSKSELFCIKRAMEELQDKFDFDGEFRGLAKWFSKIGHFESVKRDSNKFWKPWTWNRYDHAIENFAKHVVASVDQVVLDKRFAELRLRKRVSDKLKFEAGLKRQEAYVQACGEVRSVVASIDGLGGIEEQLAKLKNIRERIEVQGDDDFGERRKLTSLALRLLDGWEYGLQNGLMDRFVGSGGLDACYKRRLLSVIKALENGGERECRSYEITDRLRAYAEVLGVDVGGLGEIDGNSVQHAIYQEALTFLDESAGIKNDYNLGSVVRISDIIAHSVDYAIECGKHQEYQKGFDLLDLASGMLGIAKGAVQVLGYGLGKVVDGVRLGLEDVCDLFAGSEGACELPEDFEGGAQKLFDASNELYDSVSDFIAKVREQPIKESVGDSLQILSRELTKMSVVAGVVLGVMTAAEAGVAIAAGATSLFALRDVFGEFVTKLIGNGSVAIEEVAAVPVGQAVAVPLGLACEKLYGFSEAAINLWFAMQGDGAKEKNLFNGVSSIAGVPDKAYKTLNIIEETGDAPSGYRGGAVFINDARGGGEVLPRADSQGLAISYKEWDVNPYQKGANRGAERLVIGSDGSAYYTSDHYNTFIRIK